MRASTRRGGHRSPTSSASCTGISSARCRATGTRIGHSGRRPTWCLCMSRRTELWWGLLLAGAVTVAAIAGLRRGTPPPDVGYRTSAFLSGPRGSEALCEVLARLRFPVERRRAPLFELTRATARRPAVLLVLGPVIPLLPAELAQVARFAHTGGSVVAAAGGGGIARCAGWRPRHAPSPFLDDTIGVLPPRPGLRAPPPPPPRPAAGAPRPPAKGGRSRV